MFNIFFSEFYEVRQFNSRNRRSVSLGSWVGQTHVLKHVWTCSNLHLHEPHTKWVVRSRAAEEVVRVRGIRLRCICVGVSNIRTLQNNIYTAFPLEKFLFL